MSEDILSRAQHLSDQDLLERLKALAQHEREATVALIAHLAVLDERCLYLGEGHPSLFAYCTEVLHLAEYAAYNRIEAARAARNFPTILGMLAEGAITLATVRLLAPHLTPANHTDLLMAARYKSKREVEELAAQLCPKPSVPSTVRLLPTPHREPSPLTIEATAPAAILPARPSVVEPLGSRRYRMQFTASAETCDKLRLAQDLLRHQIPDGDLGEIFDRALTLLIETLAKQKFAETRRPRERATGRNGGQNPVTRHIPADVRRTVWLRDAGRCAFVAHMGRRCTARGFLEFHHLVPYGAGGAATPDNIQLRCRAHNRYEAELYFGGVITPVKSIRSGPNPDLESSLNRERDHGDPRLGLARAGPG